MPISPVRKSRAKTIFLVLIIAGVAVMISSLVMALIVTPSNPFDLYVVESTALSVGMVMLCMGMILMKNGEDIFGTEVTETEKKKMHDEMHDQVMAEMRLSKKDLEIQQAIRASDDELFK